MPHLMAIATKSETQPVSGQARNGSADYIRILMIWAWNSGTKMLGADHPAESNRPSQAVFHCGACGFRVPADHNAAINILVRAGLPLAPVPARGTGAAARQGAIPPFGRPQGQPKGLPRPVNRICGVSTIAYKLQEPWWLPEAPCAPTEPSGRTSYRLPAPLNAKMVANDGSSAGHHWECAQL